MANVKKLQARGGGWSLNNSRERDEIVEDDDYQFFELQSEEHKAKLWKEFIDFVKDNPDTLLSLVQAEPVRPSSSL